ncbi:hypothetical protein RHMOL_Rhmol13G0191800 [Rhododendron molle]|uniref:Uncharacterized protein n=1 Tax=Rhododendron molle TaxID=49168 RepID=A0ACC0L9I4_RHOML|nr:hypothetical protein RHMOL_Rhmol13G0191800 [Rhododendron molle]
MASKDSHTEFLAVAIDAAKKAGDVIRKGFYVTKHVEHKGQVDLVTETDKACEDLIFNHLKQHFPNHKFIGEETTAAYGVTELTDEATWIVDPLDGTTNFVHGFPFVCVSIGLTIEKVAVVGVVYNPIMDELFAGSHGKGAFLNGNPIKVSSQSELVKSLLCTEGKGKGLVLQFDSQHGGSQPLKLTPSTAYSRDLKVNMMLGTSKSMWNFGFMFSHSEHADAEEDPCHQSRNYVVGVTGAENYVAGEGGERQIRDLRRQEGEKTRGVEKEEEGRGGGEGGSSIAYVRKITYFDIDNEATMLLKMRFNAGTQRDKPTVDATTNRINSLLFKVRSLRMCGSCALDLCGIACGRLDLFYELGFGGPWDVAGGAVIVKEAGGVIFDPSGKEFDITSQRVAASNPFLKDAFVEALRESE